MKSKNPPSPPAVIVLAAGKGTRMKSDLPKVLHGVAGRPMVAHVLDAVYSLAPAKVIVVVGFGAEAVEAAVGKSHPKVIFVRQTEQKGTGHAVQMAKAALKGFEGDILIVNGDVPLVRGEALAAMLEGHRAHKSAVCVGSVVVENPFGLGRILRDKKGKFLAIREQKDCTPQEAKICEGNTGLYVVQGKHLWKLLDAVKPNNAQGEYYLTDIVALGLKAKLGVCAKAVEQDAPELLGVNSRAQLAEAEMCMQDQLRDKHMVGGATLSDPASVFFSVDTKLGQDVTIGQNVVFGPGVVVENGVEIRPFCHLEGCVIKKGAIVGPFARVRPGSVIGEDAHLGNFVEVKNSVIGKGSKANHLTYVGDADVGADVNLGAGTITANYNRKTGKKTRTTIGDGASTGSQTVLVAPVKLGKGSYTGAGTVVRKDVEDKALVVGYTDVKVKKGYGK